MKKALLLSMLITFAFTSTTYASEQAAPVQSSTEEAIENTFTFRDIPWYTSKAEVEQIFENEGFEISEDTWTHYARRIKGIEFLNTMSGSDYVDGGGYAGAYYGVDVAGYSASRMGACYIYAVDNAGNINKSDDDAQFYFGWYEFDNKDFADGEGIYNDLAEKLTSIYGEGEENNDSDYFTTMSWHDSSNNQIKLLLGGKDRDPGEKYVTLGYIAADADDRLNKIQEALNNEKAAEEAAARESNKDNVSGL